MDHTPGAPRAHQPRTRLRAASSAARTVLVAGLVTSLLAACTQAEPTDPGSPTEGVPSDATATDIADGADETQSVEDPDTPVGHQVAWVVSALDPTAEVTEEDVRDHVSPATLEELPASDLRVTLAQMALSGPFVVTAYEAGEDGALATVSDARGTELELTVTVSDASLIHTLLFQPPYDHVEARSWQEVSDAVGRLPADTTLVVTRVGGDGVSEVVFDVGEQGPAPIGSIVKLYVLGALTQVVADGAISWEDEVVVTDSLRSLPSGRLQDAETGTAVTVREAAELMISISDNTATDLLIDALGRERVEAAVLAMGHGQPDLLTPFPSTRELFQLAWSGDAEDRDARRARWREGPEAEQRTLLRELPETLEVDAASVTDAAWPDGLDWFADTDDLMAAWTWLSEAAETPAGTPLPEILSMNPGLPPETAALADAVWFKGGSAPGELALTWWVQGGEADATGSPSYVVTLQAHHTAPIAVADARPFAALGADAVRLALTPGQ